MTIPAVTTLADFLLARIAEDEATLPTIVDDHLAVETPFGFLDWPARVLAECAAKRALVEMAVGTVAMSDAYPFFLLMLKTLALPYAKHPDYREKWRP